MKANSGDFFVSRQLGLLEIYDGYQELAKRRGLLANFDPLKMLGEMALGLELLRKRLRKSKVLPGMRLTIDETTRFLVDQESKLHPAARLNPEVREHLLTGTDFVGKKNDNSLPAQRSRFEHTTSLHLLWEAGVAVCRAGGSTFEAWQVTGFAWRPEVWAKGQDQAVARRLMELQRDIFLFTGGLGLDGNEVLRALTKKYQVYRCGACEAVCNCGSIVRPGWMDLPADIDPDYPWAMADLDPTQFIGSFMSKPANGELKPSIGRFMASVYIRNLVEEGGLSRVGEEFAECHERVSGLLRHFGSAEKVVSELGKPSSELKGGVAELKADLISEVSDLWTFGVGVIPADCMVDPVATTRAYLRDQDILVQE